MRAVVVLGGNAFQAPDTPLTMSGQFRFARQALTTLVPLFDRGTELVLGHGNGPQVGHILTRVEEALGRAYAIPLEVCVAESVGELGYVLQQSLQNVLFEHGIARPVVSVLNQVVVSADDPGFDNPTKPIGPFYDAARADELRSAGFRLREDSGRGYRRVVASPEPLEIVEVDVVRRLVEMGVIVIAAGGGGVPVVREAGRVRGVEAVVDKDLAAALLGKRIGADLFVIVTGVPCAYRDFGTERAEPLGRVTPAEVRALARAGHFPAGSMGPKMEAAARFADEPDRRTIVCDAASLGRALRGEAGTIVSRTQ
jgi:carbamate kinase